MRSAIAIAVLGISVSAQPVAVGQPASPHVIRAVVIGVSNYAEIPGTVAIAGAMAPQAAVDLKSLGFRSIINLRQAAESGANVDAEGTAARAAGLNYLHLPLNGSAPDPVVVDRFLKAITSVDNQPALVHCASGNRAAAMWMIKRMVIDNWDAARADAEASALGLTSDELREFALQYAAQYRRRIT